MGPAVESGGDTRLRALRIALGLALAGLLVQFWPVLCTAPGLHWNPARLAPSFALAYGKSIYALRNSAEQLGWIYGPVFPLWYLPVTFTANPTVALVLATLVNAITLIVPVMLALRYAGVETPWSRAAGGLAFVALFFAHPILRWQFYFIHVDGVCLALGLAACLALHAAVTRDRPGLLHLAALAVALAVWTKQLAILIAPGMGLWLWADGHRRWIFPFFFRCVVHTAAVTVATFLWLGAEPVLFNLVYFHLRRSPEDGWWRVGRWFADIVGGMWSWLPLAGATVWLARRPGGTVGQDARRTEATARRHSFVRLLLWVALSQAPLGVLALGRSGGGVNSLHSLHYVLIAGLVMTAAALERNGVMASTGSGAGRGSPVAPVLAWAGALVLTVAIGFVHTRREKPEWTLYRGQEELVARIRAAPNTYYLPWNPLVTLIGERKIYPFDDALMHLSLRQLEVPPDVVRAALPPKPILLYYEPVQSTFALRYFPEMKR